jgi:hypothetical protein
MLGCLHMDHQLFVLPELVPRREHLILSDFIQNLDVFTDVSENSQI